MAPVFNTGKFSFLMARLNWATHLTITRIVKEAQIIVCQHVPIKKKKKSINMCLSKNKKKSVNMRHHIDHSNFNSSKIKLMKMIIQFVLQFHHLKGVFYLQGRYGF